MQSRSQIAVLKQLHRYLITQNVTEKFVPHLLTSGYCYGFSLCRAAMRKLGKLAWWKACLDRVLAWDGKVDSLTNEFVLPGAREGKAISLGDIFKRVTHYILFNHVGDPYDYVSQLTFLLPDGPFILQKNDEEILHIKSNHRIAGSFTKDDFIDLLDDKAAVQAIKDNICLVHDSGHTCELGYEDGKWTFYNPNYLDGEAKYFLEEENLIDLMAEIISVLGKDICIELACLEDLKSKPFSYYDTLLDECPKRLMQNEGLYMISKHTVHLVPYFVAKFLEDAKNNIPYAILNWIDPHGWTPLMYAAQHGHAEAIQVLCAAGAEVNQVQKAGWSPLIIAAQYGHIKAVQVLCAAGAKVDHVEARGRTALMVAACYGHVDTVVFLLKQGACLNKHCPDGGATSLMFAVQCGHIEVVNTLLPLADLTMTISAGVSFLLDFAGQSRRQQVETLLKSQHDDILPDKVPGFTVLHLAVFFGHTDIVMALLNKMSELTIGTIDELCQYAMAMDHVEIHTLLTSRVDALNKKEISLQAGCTLFNNKSAPANLPPIGELSNRIVI